MLHFRFLAYPLLALCVFFSSQLCHAAAGDHYYQYSIGASQWQIGNDHANTVKIGTGVGVEFSDYFALETNTAFYRGTRLNPQLKINTYEANLLAVGNLHLTRHWFVFAKGGVTVQKLRAQMPIENDNSWRVRPMMSTGGRYAIDLEHSIEANWSYSDLGKVGGQTLKNKSLTLSWQVLFD